MNKRIRIISLVLCFTFLLSACDSSSKHHKKHKRDRDDSSVTSEETEESEETTESTTEETTERTTTTTAETTLPSETEVVELSESDVYSIIRDFATTIHEESPDALFAWRYGDLNVRLSPDDDTYVTYSVGEDGTVYGDCVEYPFVNLAFGAPVFTYDEFMNFPVPLSSPFSIIDSIDDGTYYGDVVAISSDSSSAVLCVGEPIDLALLSDVNIVFNEDTLEYEGDFIYNGQTYSADEVDSEICYRLCNSNDINTSGYLLGDSDCMLPINMHYVIVPISSDCEFAANGPWSFYYNSEDLPFGSYTHTGSFFDTMMYSELSEYRTDVFINDYWYLDFHILIEPVVISNGEITEMTLGVR